ncbi:MAG: molybdopterin molybdotransferase [Candidatus Azotimanducaceae bacterium]|jgi:molybdopterin molybdotransferase
MPAVTSSLTTVDEVISTLLAHAASTLRVKRVEKVGLASALGRILAEDITASVDVPAAANSAMDGYALNVTDPQMRAGGTYPVADRIAAGYVGQPWQSGTLSRIFTGAPMPAGADSVVIQEDTQLSQDLVTLLELPVPGANVRPQGQDISFGQTVLHAGRRLLPQDLGLAASVGVCQVSVYEQLRVGLMCTGDELVEPPGPLLPGQIYNSNHYTLAGLISQLGMQVVNLGLVADTPESTQQALLRGAAEADVIVSSGGVSVGEEDHVKAVVEALGSLDLWRLAIKPGKPLAFGNVKGVPFFGLPGNPVSSFVTFMLIARPYLLKLQGASVTKPLMSYARADFSRPAGRRREYLRVKLTDTEHDEISAQLYPQQGSGVMSSVSWADGLAEQEVDQAINRGDWMKVYPFAS